MLRDPILGKPSGTLSRTFNLCANFTVLVGDRDRWSAGEPLLDNESIEWYTDGSKADSYVGVLELCFQYFPTLFKCKLIHFIPRRYDMEFLIVPLCQNDLKRNSQLAHPQFFRSSTISTKFDFFFILNFLIRLFEASLYIKKPKSNKQQG